MRGFTIRQAGSLTLIVACFVSLAICALLLLQAAGLIRPPGVGWGDGTRGRAYSIEANTAIVLRTASELSAPPTGNYVYKVQTVGWTSAFGISLHRWNMTAGSGPNAPTLGRFAEVQVAPVWPVLLAVLLGGLCLVSFVKRRRRARAEGICVNCGYDLRATPDRCPECGRVAA